MRIAIATENRDVCQHFGHCPEYSIFTIEDKEIQKTEVIPNPGHRPDFLPGYLHQQGVDVIIAGGMGPVSYTHSEPTRRTPLYSSAASDVYKRQIQKTEVIPNPGHRPDFLPGYLHQQGVDVIIAGGMG